jgi:hypothetical protein
MDSSLIVTPPLLGGLLGMIGQSIRIIVGLKKTYDTSQQQNIPVKDVFDTRQLLISLLIGFVAGCLITLLKFNFGSQDPLIWSRDLTIEVIAVGYAGTDFIEGFMKKYLPPADSAATANRANTAVAGTSTENIAR